MKKVLITGISGQDGSYLAELLSVKGYEVYGTCRTISNCPPNINQIVKGLYEVNLETPGQIKGIIREVKPDEIYHLAAHHFSSQKDGNSKNSFIPFNAINLLVTNEVLETIHRELMGCRFFYASSCQVFGKVEHYPQTEETIYKPDSFYAIAKAAANQLCKFYRDKEGVYASVGILYNHESERRGPGFVTSEIALAAAQASLGMPVKLKIRDLAAIVDWGAAKDYVNAMWLSLQQSTSDEYIIASGVARTVNDFAVAAFKYVGLNSNNYVFQDENAVRGQRNHLIGDPSKIKSRCNWKPDFSFDSLVSDMVKSRINSFKN